MIRDSGIFLSLSSEFRVFRYVMVHEKPDGDERFSEQIAKEEVNKLNSDWFLSFLFEKFTFPSFRVAG